jgi:hypothetical protein
MPAARKLGKRAAQVERRYFVANMRSPAAAHRNGVAVVVGMVVDHGSTGLSKCLEFRPQNRCAAEYARPPQIAPVRAERPIPLLPLA